VPTRMRRLSWAFPGHSSSVIFKISQIAHRTSVILSRGYFQYKIQICTIDSAVSKRVALNWIDRPDSSVISRFCYDSERRVLVIEFKHGGIYDYYDVPESVFEEMSNASSAGRYYNANVKDVYRVTGPR